METDKNLDGCAMGQTQAVSENLIPVYSVYQKTMHTPLALGSILAYVRHYKGGELLRDYKLIPHLFYSKVQIAKALRKNKKGIFLFSNYIWNEKYHLQLSQYIKAKSPESIIIHGGPSVPNREGAAVAYMEKHTSIDFLVQGEGEVTLAELLEELLVTKRTQRFGLIPGLTYRVEDSQDIVVNTARVRAKTLDDFPSAYDEEMFECLDTADIVAGIVETNRGCPYGCTYCDWGTRQRIRIFPMEKVEKEIEWIAKKKISVLWITDANFGILPRDLEIAKRVAALKKHYGYPKQLFVNYAKNSTKRLADIVSILADSGLAAEGIISIQTRDQDTLNIVERENIKNESFDELIEIFRQKKLPIASDLMIGLPGSTLETLKSDTQYFFDRDIKVKVYHSQVLPNAPMAHPTSMAKYAIETDEDGFIKSCSSFSRDELLNIEKYSEVFITVVMFGILKYFLKYLQLEHKVQASEFIHKLTDCVYGDTNTQYVIIREVLNLFTLRFDQKSQSIEYDWRLIFVNWRAFYQEVQKLTFQEFAVAPSDEMAWVLSIQSHLNPSPWKRLPVEIPLKHDLEAYFKQMEVFADSGDVATIQPLRTFGPGQLTVSDPNGFCNFKFYFRFFYNIHIIRFQLESNLSVDKDKAVFVNETEGLFSFWIHRIYTNFRHLLLAKDHYSALGNMRRSR